LVRLCAEDSEIKREYQIDCGKVIFKRLRRTDWKALGVLLDDGECTVDRMISVLRRVIEDWTLPGDPSKSASYREMNELTFAQLCHAAQAYFADALLEFKNYKRLAECG